MSNVPSSTGIGAPGTQAAPASLARSPMSSQPAGSQAAAVPFVRGSSLATMQDYSNTQALTAGASVQIQLQTNAFLAYVVIDISLTTSGNSATVAFNGGVQDSPWSVLSSVSLNDPANQAIITPITGYGLYILNKYLTDTGCRFDPQQDPNYSTTTGTVGTGGSFSFRLVVPVEHRKRDALGAVNNSAANQRYLLTLTAISTFGGTTGLYTTAPTTPATYVSVTCTQLYWTSPPASITTSSGSTAVQQTPTGLGTVGFVRYERHNEVSGGGSPQIQLNNVGDYLSGILFVLRLNTTNNPRDTNAATNSTTSGNWPSPFTWWINDFQVHSLLYNFYVREIARFYGYTNSIGSAGGLDNGVWPLWYLVSLFDRVDNFGPANQYLPTDATTKLQIRGATFGVDSNYLEIYTRAIRPVSGAALFS